MSYDVVKTIGGRRYGVRHRTPKIPLKSGVKPQDWQRTDADTLPLVGVLSDSYRVMSLPDQGGLQCLRLKRYFIFPVSKSPCVCHSVELRYGNMRNLRSNTGLYSMLPGSLNAFFEYSIENMELSVIITNVVIRIRAGED